MAQATDQQMQAFADTRVRQRAEQFRTAVNALRDDKTAIESVYDRAANGAAWNDARIDGPPKLLTSADMLTFNTVATLLLKAIDGTATSQDITSLAANWPVFQAACVRSIG
jgi:hypothetical protein